MELSQGAVGIAAVDGNDGARRHYGVVPAGDEIERHVEAAGEGELFEFEDVRFAGTRAALRVLVLKLDGDDGTAVFPEQAFELIADLAVPGADRGEIHGIVLAGRALLEHPIGQAAVAHFGVVPGADARDQIHAVFGAKLGKGAQVALARPVELALDLFVMDPDHVGGDDIDARRPSS